MRRVCAVLAALLASSQVATAFAPRKTDLVRVRTPILEPSAPRAARAPIAALAQQGWRASWDRDTGVPAWLWGRPVAAPGSVADGALAERAARAFLAEHVAVLAPGATASDFTLVTNDRTGELRTVTLQQTWRGMRVAGGHVGFVFGRDQLFAIRSTARPHVDAAPAPRASTTAQALARVEAWLAGETGTQVRARTTGERVVVADISPAGITYRIADVLDAVATTGPERWEVLATPDGTPLERRSLVMFATGTLAYNVGLRHAGGPRADIPAGAATITVDGASTTTGADGAFAWTGNQPATVVPGVSGPLVDVIDQGGAPVTGSLTAQPGATTVWNRASDELADAQLSAFIYTTLGKARARIVNPSLATWLDTPLPVFVNKTGSCNAYSTGDDIHVFRASATCENTGRVGDVVVHELGHAVHNNSLIEGIGAFESHLSEGVSDFFAANLTGDPAVGRGLFKSEEPMRDIDPPGFERVYPADFDYDPHLSGLIIAGALWDLRKALIAELGESAGVARTEQIFTGILRRADGIPATYMAALIADDDDADLLNGTPNGCAIERAFGEHGLVPGYVATALGPPRVEGLAVTVPVTPPGAGGCARPEVTGMTLTWRANDGVASQLSLVDDGSDQWSATLPDQPDGTLVTYAIDVELSDGSTRRLPSNEADAHYQLFVGDATPIWCETFDTDPGWEQTSTTGFEWQWGPARVDSTTDDPDAAFSGSHVLGTDITGDGDYRPGIVSSIATPVIDVSGWTSVRLQYRRWLTVEDATYDVATIAANDVEIWRNARSINATLDHVDREWRLHDLDLTPHVVDGQVSVRWALTTDNSKQLGGWTLDDVCIVGLGRIPRCGDGVVDSELGERCDDGNREDDDGCSAVCGDEPTSGGGGCCSSSAGAGSTIATALGVLALLGRRRRRGA